MGLLISPLFDASEARATAEGIEAMSDTPGPKVLRVEVHESLLPPRESRGPDSTEGFEMKDLSSLEENLRVFMLLAAAGRLPADGALRRQIGNFVRVVDLAIYEYQRARAYQLQKYRGIDRLASTLRAVDHLELAVITLRRAVLSLGQLSREEGVPGVDRTMRKMVANLQLDVKDVRDWIIHVDEKISSGLFPVGESHVLLLSDDGSQASMGRFEVSTTRLAILLETLHVIAATLMRHDWRETGSDTPPPGSDHPTRMSGSALAEQAEEPAKELEGLSAK
jgi:hypothetical protein